MAGIPGSDKIGNGGSDGPDYTYDISQPYFTFVSPSRGNMVGGVVDIKIKDPNGHIRKFQVLKSLIWFIKKLGEYSKFNL
jgi:hypothetical protein